MLFARRRLHERSRIASVTASPLSQGSCTGFQDSAGSVGEDARSVSGATQQFNCAATKAVSR